MTLQEAIEDAREGSVSATRRALAWLIDALGEAQPCAYLEPIVKADDIELVDIAGHYTPVELRAMCAMWLHAADEAEELVP